MFQSLLSSKQVIQGTAVDESTDFEKAMRKTAFDDDIFWPQNSCTLKMIKPLADAITILESDKSNLSDVYETFVKLQHSVEEALSQSPLTQAEENSVRQYLIKRREFSVHAINYAANLVHPVHMGKNLAADEVSEGIELLGLLAEQMNLDSGVILANLAEFRCKEGFWSKPAICNSAAHLSPCTWWKGLCVSQPIAVLAGRVLSIPATTAAAERSFSTFGTVHTKLRNKLSNVTTNKLVTIRSNLPLFDNNTKPTAKSCHQSDSIVTTRVQQDDESESAGSTGCEEDADNSDTGETSSSFSGFGNQSEFAGRNTDNDTDCPNE
jgi:hypothetical protein